MANPEHLRLLREGVEEWNAWYNHFEVAMKFLRPDLAGLFPDRVDLTDVDFDLAHLRGVDLHFAELTHATFVKANLREANLQGANLTGADLSEAHLFETVFFNTDLTAVRGLETCHHTGPSTLDHRTLAKSGPLPLVFLRGCGLPDALISYLPSLLNEPFQFYSCFISYASKTVPSPNASMRISRTKVCTAGLPQKT